MIEDETNRLFIFLMVNCGLLQESQFVASLRLALFYCMYEIINVTLITNK